MSWNGNVGNVTYDQLIELVVWSAVVWEETSPSHLGKRKIIHSKVPLGRVMKGYVGSREAFSVGI